MKNIKESYKIKGSLALDGSVKEITRNRTTVSLYNPFMKTWGIADFTIESEEYCLRFIRKEPYYAEWENRIEIHKKR